MQRAPAERAAAERAHLAVRIECWPRLAVRGQGDPADGSKRALEAALGGQAVNLGLADVWDASLVSELLYVPGYRGHVLPHACVMGCWPGVEQIELAPQGHRRRAAAARAAAARAAAARAAAPACVGTGLSGHLDCGLLQQACCIPATPGQAAPCQASSARRRR
jgi:hypothetical protein